MELPFKSHLNKNSWMVCQSIERLDALIKYLHKAQYITLTLCSCYLFPYQWNFFMIHRCTTFQTNIILLVGAEAPAAVLDSLHLIIFIVHCLTSIHMFLTKLLFSGIIIEKHELYWWPYMLQWFISACVVSLLTHFAMPIALLLFSVCYLIV